MRCPNCGKKLASAGFGGDTGIDADFEGNVLRCSRCGTEVVIYPPKEENE